MKATLTVAELRTLLAYEPATGVLTWLVSRGKASVGKVAGVLDDRGYVVLGILGKRYYAHRVAVALMTGEWPADLVDHMDGNRTNNRWSNLRVVSHAVNQQNKRAPSRNNKSGLLGVRAFGKKFRAQLCVNGESIYLGTFATAEAAHEAYVAAKRQNHEGCTL